MFFGRELAIRQSVERLREAGADDKRLPFLLILGASGAGKSSLLRAGLLPSLTCRGRSRRSISGGSPCCAGTGPRGRARPKAFSALRPSARSSAGRVCRRRYSAQQLAGDPAPRSPASGSARQGGRGAPGPANYDARVRRGSAGVDQGERLFTEAEPAKAARLPSCGRGGARKTRLCGLRHAQRRLSAVAGGSPLCWSCATRARVSTYSAFARRTGGDGQGSCGGLRSAARIRDPRRTSLADAARRRGQGWGRAAAVGMTLARLYRAGEEARGQCAAVRRLSRPRGRGQRDRRRGDENAGSSEKAELPRWSPRWSATSPPIRDRRPAPVIAPLDRRNSRRAGPRERS